MRLDRIKFFAGAAVLAMLMIFSISRINVSAEGIDDISAKAAVVYNGETGEVLYERNPHDRLPMASTTKIMSALLVLERDDLDEPFTVDSDAVMTEGSSMGLTEGDEVTLRDLACGMLLPSGNDAANAAAVRVAGSVEDFVKLMNLRAVQLGMYDTHFVTPSGLDDYTDNHYSSAADMARLAYAAMQNENFREICGLKKAKVHFGSPPFDRWLTNTNKLLDVSGFTGIKTGFTDKAGRCLVSACMRDGCELICVTLSDPNDWRDHKALMDYGFSKTHQVRLRAAVQSLTVRSADGRQISCDVPEMVISMTDEGRARTEVKLYIEHFIYEPFAAGDKVGEAVFELDGHILGRRDIRIA